MPSYRLDTLVELEQSLSLLRAYYGPVMGMEPPDLLKRAKSFLDWSLVAVEYSGPWSKVNLLKAGELVVKLENPQPGLLVCAIEDPGMNTR